MTERQAGWLQETLGCERRIGAVLLVLLLAGCGLAVLTGNVWLSAAALGSSLLYLSLYDAQFMVLPDVVTLPLIVVGLLNALWSEPVLLDRALGAGIGLVVLPLLNSVYRAIRKRNGIGFGDAKLLAAAGAWLGWMALPYMLLIASMAGLATVLVMMWRQLPAKKGHLSPGCGYSVWAFPGHRLFHSVSMADGAESLST